MKINIYGSNLDLTEAIKSYVNDKISSLDKFYDNILEARVEVGKTTNHHQKGDVFYAEANLEVPQKGILRATSTQDDLYKAINEVKNDLQRQVKKFKEKNRGY